MRHAGDARRGSEAFADYGAALDHADRAHPDRVTVDPRTAVEAM
jgi:hypothetical protein